MSHKLLFNVMLHISFLMFWTISDASGMIYYVSNTGNDAWNGQASTYQGGNAGPWNSISQINNYNFNPGDQILFQRDGIWRDTLLIHNSGNVNQPIIFGAYGTGAKPVITGSSPITGWTAYNGSICRATVNNPVTQLFVNGKRQIPARSPNTGFFNLVKNGDAQHWIIKQALTVGDDYWNGATVFTRSWPWYAEEKTITDYTQSVQQIILNSSVNSTLTGIPCYIENLPGTSPGCLDLLDSPEEWYYNSTTDYLYLWLPAGVTLSDLNNGAAEISASDASGIVISNNAGYIQIENLYICNFSSYGISTQNPSQAVSNITVLNNTITQIGTKPCLNYGAAVYLPYGSYLHVTGNTLSCSLYGILAVRAQNSDFTYNRINDIGFNGISVPGLGDTNLASSNTISYNYVERCCLTLDDGGGIYTQFATNTTISNNIVKDIIGSHSDPSIHQAYGIYLDYHSNHATVSNNIVINADCGIFSNNPSYATISNNTVYMTRECAMELNAYNYNDLTNNVVNSNIFFPSPNAKDCITTYNGLDGTSPNNFFTGDNNYYGHKYVKGNNANTSNLSLPAWQNVSGNDPNSVDLYSYFDLDGLKSVIYLNDDAVNSRTVYPDYDYLDLYGNSYAAGSAVTLQPFTAKIFINRNSLRGYWQLDEPGGSSAFDSTANRNNGTVCGGATWAAGYTGGALSFDGSTGYVNCGNKSSLQLSGDLTLSFWMYPTNITKGRQNLLDKSYGGEFSLVLEPDGALTFYHGNGGYYWQGNILPPGTVQSDQWQHITITRDAVNRAVKCFYNYSLIASVTYPDEVNKLPGKSTAPVYIGKGFAGFFAGKIDDVLLGSSCTDSNLAGYWPLDEVTGYSYYAFDSAANINDGMLHGGTAWTASGYIGGALSFDGSTGYVDCGNKSSLQLDGDLALSFWMYPTNITKGRQTLIDKNYGGEFSVIMEPAGGLSFYHGTARQSGYYWQGNILPSGTIQNNQWQHIIIARDATARTVRCFYNDSLITTVTYPSDVNKQPTKSTEPVYIGELNDSFGTWFPYYFAGRIDDVRISSSWINNSKVASSWLLNETSGYTAFDAAANNDGTVHGGATWTASGHSDGAVYCAVIICRCVKCGSNPSLQLNGNLTLSFWMYPTNIAKGRQNPLDKNAGGEFCVVQEPDGGLSFYHGTSLQAGYYWNGGNHILPANTIQLNQWQHITITRDAATRTVKCFYNDNLIATVTYPDELNRLPRKSLDSLFIGKGVHGFFAGKIDDIQISN
ncbi:MAG: LamG-like jellyroll fold domain-containing protein [Victivallaceae bacterium]|jgi:parallel beta-helix repeat protein